MTKRKHKYGRCEATTLPWVQGKGGIEGYDHNILSGPRKCRRSATHYCRGLYICETHARICDEKNPAWFGKARVRLTKKFFQTHLLP